MEFSIKTGSPEKQRSGCIVVGVFEGRRQSDAFTQLDTASNGFLSELLKRGDLTGKSGSTLLLHQIAGIRAERVLLVGLGKPAKLSEKVYRDAVRSAAKVLLDTPATDAVLTLTSLPVKKRGAAWRARQASLLLEESAYRFGEFKHKKPVTLPKLTQVTLLVADRKEQTAAQSGLEQGLAIAEGQTLARTLGNLPGNVCTPTYLADEARRMAVELHLDCTVLEESDMQALGMGSLLSVAKGSIQPPKLIALSYRGAGEAKPVVLVGKGITFDTGGISLKPGADMDEMKFDMCGAASVLGTMQSVARMKLPVNLTVIVPTCENMPGGRASKPGDIVTSMSGQTIEILNTDAEGRLILCDALTYAERFEPDAVIDVATLTGACVVALGAVASGLFSNSEPLAKDLLKAGDEAHDRAWRMPLWDDYQDLLKSNFADMAHLDIAGVSHKSGGEKGATGRPVPLLSHYLLARAGLLD